MNEERQGKFVQFPLSLLAMTRPFRDIVGHAISYATRQYFEKCLNSLCPSDDFTEDEIAEYTQKLGECEEEAFASACSVIGISGGDPSQMARETKTVATFAAAFEQTEHKPAIVRIPTDYAFEMRNGDWSESQSRVFIAVASAIGCKPYARLGWEQAALRAAGYVRPKRTTPPLQLMTRNQVDYALRRLVDRNLLTGFTLNKGVRYWSFPNVCKREQIARFVLEKRAKRERRETDAELQARILAEIKEGKDSSR